MFGLMKETADPHPHAARRAAVRRQIAELRLHGERHKEILAAIARVDAEVDAAEEQHEAAIRPIQDELGLIRGETVDATIAGESLPAVREARRRELQDALDAENEKLREAVRRADDQRMALQHELIVVGGKMKTVDGNNLQTLENKLAGELARPEQQLQTYVANSAVNWANARVEAAERAHRDTAAIVADKEQRGEQYQLPEVKARLARFAAELDAAREALALAGAYQKELRNQIIAE